MGRAGSGPEFHVNSGSGRVGLGHFICGSGWVGSRKMDQCPTLIHAHVIIDVKMVLLYLVLSRFCTL